MKDKYKTLIISCWVVLLCCFVVKLLGGNFFEIVCNNENYIKLAKFLSKGVPYWIVSILSYTLSTTIYFMTICKLKKPKLLFIISCLIFIILKLTFMKYGNYVMLIEILFSITIPLIYNKKLLVRSIVGVVLNLGFQIISLLIKNVGIKLMYDDIFTNLIFSIDYYIMLILYWLYSIKEENENGKFRFILFRKRR